MARPLRIEFENAIYHVTARGVERRRIFLDDKDYEKMIAVLARNVERHGVRLFCYVLMGNHYHLLFETPAANLSSFMHDAQSHYTGYFNRRHKRAGHLFQGRYKALIVEKDAYLVEVSRYIHLNPVRAAMAEKPEGWKWSSYAEYCGMRPRSKFVETRDVLRYFDRDPARAAREYRVKVESAIAEPPRDVTKEAAAQLILGTEAFVARMKKTLKARNALPDADILSNRQLTRWDNAEAEKALESVAARFGVSPQALKNKGGHNNFQRDVAIAVFHGFSRWPAREIGALFGVSHSAVSKTVGRLDAAMRANAKMNKEIAGVFSQFTA